MEKLATELLFYRFFAVILLLSGSAMSKEVGKNYIGQKVEINSFLFHLSHFFFSLQLLFKKINFRTTFLDHLVTCNCMQCVSWSSCFSNLMHAWCIYTSGSLSLSCLQLFNFLCKFKNDFMMGMQMKRRSSIMKKEASMGQIDGERFIANGVLVKTEQCSLPSICWMKELK